MSADEFWKDDPQLFVSYRTSFINKKKREMEEYDYKCWLQGLYIHDGNGKLNASLKQLIGNMFSSKKDTTKIDTYPTKPYMEMEKDKENKKKIDLKAKRYDNYQSSLIYFSSMKERYLKNLNKKGE